MSTAHSSRLAETPPSRVAKRARKRPGRPAQQVAAAGGPGLAGFVAAEARLVDAEKWPVHPLVWWQPQLPFELPASSGLCLERQYRIPAAGFLNREIAMASAAGLIAAIDEFLPPAKPNALPGSDLALIARDPRTSLGSVRSLSDDEEIEACR